MNIVDIDLNALNEDLEKEGLTTDEARAKLTQAFQFLMAVLTNQLDGKMLSDTIIQKQRELTVNVAAWIASYRKSGMPGIAAEAYRAVMPVGINSLGIILVCEELAKLGILKEWTLLDGETRQWRETYGTDPNQRVSIHPDVRNAGTHVWDFRKGRDGSKFRGNRHFLPADWHNRAQIQLCQYLTEAAKTAKETYDAAHPKQTNMRAALERSGLVPKVGETAAKAPAPAVIPLVPDVPVAAETPKTGTLRFAEDMADAPKPKTKRTGKKGGKRRQRHDPDNEEE